MLAETHSAGGVEPPVVLVSASVVQDADSAGDFVTAARRVEPRVRLGLLRTGAAFDPSAAGCFEFEVWLDADAAGIRRAIDSRRSAPVNAAPEPAKPVASIPGPFSAAPPAPAYAAPTAREPAELPPESDLPGERAIVEALLSSGDVLGPALDHLRRTLGCVQIDFVPALGDAPPPRPARGQHVAGVAHRERVYAFIVGPASAARALDDGAAWLGAWLALREQHASLKHAAFTDPLTGAWNRRYFDRFLSTALSEARTKRRDLSILLFDIDDFKNYNDRWGHAAGDEILRETVRLLTSVIRPSDRVCRIGGDEFAVIFDEPQGPRDPRSRHPSSILEVARRFQKQIETASFPKLGSDAPGRLTISGGMATYPWDAADAEGLVAHADRLVLESKRHGKNAISIGPDARSL